MKPLFHIFLSVFLFSVSSFASPGKHFDRVITVIFENTNYTAALNQPFFNYLSKTGASFSNFMALIHPSQGNYIALTSGALNGVLNDNMYDVNAPNIIDLLERKGVSWKIYAEDYPGNCFTGKSSGMYVRKHNPFISYINIQNDSQRCANIVNASEFDADIAAGKLPQYVFYIPNMKNDGHDTGVAYANNWYQQRFGPLVQNAEFMKNTILVSTFDESGKSPLNQIYTSIVGPMVIPGEYSQSLTIPSLLKMVEDNWDLGNLGKLDATAAPVDFIWH